MKKLAFLILMACVITLSGCKSAKEIAYFQNIDEISLAASKGLYTARIMPKDELTITVNSSDPTAAAVFNLSVTKSLGNTNQMSSQQSLITYLVDMRETSISHSLARCMW